MAEWLRGMPGALFPEQGSERDLYYGSLCWCFLQDPSSQQRPQFLREGRALVETQTRH